MAKSVTGGRGVLGMNWSGKESRLDRNTTTIGRRPENPIGRRYFGEIGPVRPKQVPRTYVPTPKPPVAVAKKPPAKKPPQVITNVVRAKPSPTPTSAAAKPKTTKPRAASFGVASGKYTGTSMRGGGGYGGGGTRGGGSLSGGGSGSRTAGTSRTGGTRGNDPVRG